MLKPQARLQARILDTFWRTFSFVALSSVFIYPFYKRIPAGIVLALAGVLSTGLPRFAPGVTAALGRYIGDLTERRFLLTICMLGLIVRLPLIVFPTPPLPGDNAVYLQHAVSVAAGAGYGDSTLYPPGQSAWLAVWAIIFGPNLRSLIAVQCCISVASALFTYFGFVRYSESAARWSASFIAVFPSVVIWSGTLGHETTVFFFLSLLFFLLSNPSFAKTPWLWLLSGLIAGFTALTRPTLIVFPVLVSVCLFASGTSIRKIIVPGIATALAMLVVIAPWTIRNYKKTNELSLISTNFGIVLLSANDPQSDGIFMDQLPRFAGSGLTAVQIDHLARRMAIRSIEDDPLLFARRIGLRAIVQWGGETSIVDSAFGTEPRFGQTIRQLLRAVVQTAWASFLCACCLGFFFGRQSPLFNAPPVLFAVSFIALIAVTHVILEPIARHHLPALPFVAGIGLSQYGEWIRRFADERTESAGYRS